MIYIKGVVQNSPNVPHCIIKRGGKLSVTMLLYLC